MTEFNQTLSNRPTEVDIGLDLLVRALLRRGVGSSPRLCRCGITDRLLCRRWKHRQFV
jgi:hypothetical protein